MLKFLKSIIFCTISFIATSIATSAFANPLPPPDNQCDVSSPTFCACFPTEAVDNCEKIYGNDAECAWTNIQRAIVRLQPENLCTIQLKPYNNPSYPNYPTYYNNCVASLNTYKQECTTAIG